MAKELDILRAKKRNFLNEEEVSNYIKCYNWLFIGYFKKLEEENRRWQAKITLLRYFL